MRRREFTIFFAGALAWPIAAHAQPAKLPTIGFLGAGGQSAWTHWTAAFVQRLRELGWIEGRTVTIEYRWAEGRAERFREIAAEFARLKVDVIVTVGSAVPASKDATSTIPIVFALQSIPLAAAWLTRWRGREAMLPACRYKRLNWPANGLSSCAQIIPGLRRMAVIANVSYPGLCFGGGRGPRSSP